MRKLLNIIPKGMILPFIVTFGVLCGLAAYLVYISRAHSYLSDDPSACVNCHIMAPYYQSWNHSSHAIWASCNDCHVPHNNVFSKYMFKAIDGIYHAAIFSIHGEPQVIRPREASSEVIIQNCIRCHTQLNSEFIKMGSGKACWDCHTQVPHSKVSNLNSAPNAIVPLPKSPIPEWLKKLTQKPITQ